MRTSFDLSGAETAPAQARDRCSSFARRGRQRRGGRSAGAQALDRDLRLLVSELTANAILHGGATPARPLTVTVETDADAVNVSVTDFGSDFTLGSGGLDSEGGFGLQLVDALAECWGIERRDGRTTVWFELRER